MNAFPAEVDTAVVGGGTGGVALTGVLAAGSDESVLLLEAGPDYGPRDEGRWPAEILDARTIPLSHDWGLRSGSLDLPRARLLGGCSAHNGCTASLGAREDYDDWARRGNPGWSSAEVEPLLRWVRERFRVRHYRMTDLTPPQAAFVGAGMAAGLPYADDLDDLDAGVGIGPMPANIVDGVRWNAAFAFLDPVRRRANLRIAGDAPVRRLLFEGTRVTGLEVAAPGGTRVVRAGRVVLAAGAYGSPGLLLRSGVGPADELRAHGIEPVADLPGVGGGLLDHPCVRLDFHGTEALPEGLPDEQTVGRARSTRCDAGPYDIHVFMVAGANTGHPGLPPISLYGGAMRARSRGRVTLGGIDHRHGTDPEDAAVLREARDLLREMTAEPGLAKVLGPAAGPVPEIVSYCHPAGGCALGPAGDPLAVVGPGGAVHGVEHLHVADASIMPSITRGNINLPTAMIGARIAAHLLGRTPPEVTR